MSSILSVQADVLDLLSSYRERDGLAPAEDGRVDSLQLAWLIHEVEQRYGIGLDLTDEQLSRMDDVSGVVAVIGEATGAGDGHG